MAEQAEVTRPTEGDELHEAVVQALSGPLMGKVAILLLDELRRQLGGRSLYVAARTSERRPERDAAVRRMFNGRNRRDVQHHFGISRATLYRIVGAGKVRR